MRFGVDMDGCLANFNHSFGELLIKQSGDKLPPDWKDNTIHPKVWDWDKEAGYTQNERNKAWDYIKTNDFWFNLGLMPGAEDAIDLLNELGETHYVYFITHRTGKEAKQQTEDWLFGHGMTNPTVLVSGDNKNPLIEGLELDFFVDDKWDALIRATTLQSVKPALYIKDAPYNRTDIPGVKRVETVFEALNHFMEGK